jgi:hypothetical protein
MKRTAGHPEIFLVAFAALQLGAAALLYVLAGALLPSLGAERPEAKSAPGG